MITFIAIVVVSIFVAFSIDKSIEGHLRMPRLAGKHKNLEIEVTDDKPRSYVACFILNSYRELPKEKQVLGDLGPLLYSLEIKNGGYDEIDSHQYTHHLGTSKDIGSSSDCLMKGCSLKDFVPFKTSIDDLHAQVSRAKRNLEIAKVQGVLDTYEQSLQALRQETVLMSEENDYMENHINN